MNTARKFTLILIFLICAAALGGLLFLRVTAAPEPTPAPTPPPAPEAAVGAVPKTTPVPSPAPTPPPAPEELLLQGVVDCCLFEPDGLVIVDYKTDRISAAEAPERAGRYASQLESYAWAMSQIPGRSVKAKLVYFLRPGEAVEL